MRFAGIANNRGELVAGGHRDSVERLLPDDDVRMSIHYAIQKREIHTNLAYRVGPERSSITEYEKVATITIPISPTDLLLISTGLRDDYLGIIDFATGVLEGRSAGQ